jgi:glucoamylase
LLQELFSKRSQILYYVWPRDASFTCVAADTIGIDIQEKFFDWCIKRAEGFEKTGLFYEKYYPNGLKALSKFQPDQTGSVLWAIWHHFRNDLKKALRYQKFIERAANGICNKWKCDHFAVITNDLWEERSTFPDLQENLTYSLAACIRGLECANTIVPNERWSVVANSMRERLENHCESYFFRSYGRLSDKRVDASLLGLAYPFEIFPSNDPKIVATVKELETKLVIDGGLHRYEQDEYDGWMYGTQHRRKGAGAWPLLNLWLSIYYAKAGNKDKALQYYKWVLDKVDDFIPEQIFENDIQISVNPLCWSHSMFVLASKELRYI